MLVVPPKPLVMLFALRLNATLEHWAAKVILVPTGSGLTGTVITYVAPTHPSADVGVTT